MAQDINLNPHFMLEFSLSVIEKRLNRDATLELMYEELQKVVSAEDILGVSVVPFHSPRKVVIQCENQRAMDDLLIQGIQIEGNKIELSQPGYGAVRVTIHNAPLEMANAYLKDYLAEYGVVSGFRNNHYFHKPSGTRTDWKTGSRFAFVKLHNFENTIPPSDLITYDENKKAKILVYHEGQKEIYCRFCQENVPVDHSCEKKTKTFCFNCKSPDHMIRQCPLGKLCNICKKPGHLARNCRQQGGQAPVQYQYNAEDFPPPGPVGKGNVQTTIAGKISQSPTFCSTPLAGNVQRITAVVQTHEPPREQGDADIHHETGGEVSGDNTEDSDQWEVTRQEKKRLKKREKQLISSTDKIEVLDTQAEPKPKSAHGRRKREWSFRDMLPSRIFGLANEVEGSTLYESTVEPNTEGKDSEPKQSVEISDSDPSKNSEPKQSVEISDSDPSEMDIQDCSEVTEEPVDMETAAETETDRPETADNPDEPYQAEVVEEETTKKVEPQISTTDEQEEDSKQTEVSSLLLDQPAMLGHQLKLYSIGASNMAGLEMTGDENLKIDLDNLNNGGLNMNQAYEKLDEIHVEPRKNIKVIVTNFGSVDFSDQGGNDLISLQTKYDRSLRRIRKSCPNAEIIISSILPRNGDTFSDVNEDISNFNTFLRDLCTPGSGLYFCNNYGFILDAFHQVRSGLYKDTIHLNPEGQRFLSAHLFRAVKFVYFKSLLDFPALPEEFHYTPEEVESFLAPQHG